MSARRILIVEDEALLAMDLEASLEELGYSVAASLSSVDQALAWLEGPDAPPDAALLDINLGGETVFPVAERLADAGVPFAFATGYAELAANAGFGEAPILVKPWSEARLKRVLETL